MNVNDVIAAQTLQVVAGWLLIVSALTFLVAGLLFTARVIWRRPSAQSKRFLYWERGLVMADSVIATLGFVLLAQLLEGAGDRILSPLALTIFLIGTVLVVAAESFGLQEQAYIYTPIVVAVVLAFVGQALFGVAILDTGLVPGWVGWVTVFWNLAWLVILPFARPQDMYYPWLHYVAPLVIGIALLVSG